MQDSACTPGLPLKAFTFGHQRASIRMVGRLGRVLADSSWCKEAMLKRPLGSQDNGFFLSLASLCTRSPPPPPARLSMLSVSTSPELWDLNAASFSPPIQPSPSAPSPKETPQPSPHPYPDHEAVAAFLEGKYVASRGHTLSPRPGCHYPMAANYDSTALSDDGSCVFGPMGSKSSLLYGAALLARDSPSSSSEHLGTSCAQVCNTAAEAWSTKCDWPKCSGCADCRSGLAWQDSLVVLSAAIMVASASWLLLMPCVLSVLRRREHGSGAKAIGLDSPCDGSLQYANEAAYAAEHETAARPMAEEADCRSVGAYSNAAYSNAAYSNAAYSNYSVGGTALGVYDALELAETELLGDRGDRGEGQCAGWQQCR